MTLLLFRKNEAALLPPKTTGTEGGGWHHRAKGTIAAAEHEADIFSVSKRTRPEAVARVELAPLFHLAIFRIKIKNL